MDRENMPQANTLMLGIFAREELKAEELWNTLTMNTTKDNSS